MEPLPLVKRLQNRESSSISHDWEEEDLVIGQWKVSSRVVLAVAAALTVLILVACGASVPDAEDEVPAIATPASATESPGVTPEAPVEVAPPPASTEEQEEEQVSPPPTDPVGDPTANPTREFSVLLWTAGSSRGRKARTRGQAGRVTKLDVAS